MFDHGLLYTNHKTFLKLKFCSKLEENELFSAGEILACNYSKCSKISNTFLILFQIKCWFGIHKMLVRIANREDTDQTASSEAVWSGSAQFV